MSKATLSKPKTDLYERDFNLWLEQQVTLLRARQFEELDTANLIEEVEAIARRDKREVKSRLTLLLIHLLKYQYQPSRRTQSWLDTLDEQRRQLGYIFEDSPSLYVNYVPTIIASCYETARHQATKQTGLPLETFPEHCPYTLEQTLDETFLPQ